MEEEREDEMDKLRKKVSGTAHCEAARRGRLQHSTAQHSRAEQSRAGQVADRLLFTCKYRALLGF
jgi:hypothetical protein